ncbi:MAG: hypothetical protein NTX61_08040 [Bacteroidetes bacterium]|nr:hypothetical protein [Bacteroidota bacterium]
MKKFLISIASLFLLFSCNHSDSKRLYVDVSGIQVPRIIIHRYDIDLFKSAGGDLRTGLESIKSQYRFFLGTDLSDPAQLQKMADYLTNERNVGFHQACEAKFKNLTNIENDLTNAFRHLKYYFPQAGIPRFYSYISGGDYDNPVQMADSVVLIALDTYLGKDFKPYQADGIPLYKTERMDKDHIVPDCMKALVFPLITSNTQSINLLSQMVEAGKKLYFLDAMLPDVADKLKISYNDKQNDWITGSEAHVWAAIIENQMLYSTDNQVIRIFMSDGPFTPEFTKESPPRLGEWIGWQIVRGYMSRNGKVSLKELMVEKDAQKILTFSGYKPKK